jgi:hypothetical protein
VSPYNKQVISVWLVGLPANQDFRGFHGPDSEGISVWVSAKPAAATSNSAAARKLSATIFAYYLQAMVPI